LFAQVRVQKMGKGRKSRPPRLMWEFSVRRKKRRNPKAGPIESRRGKNSGIRSDSGGKLGCGDLLWGEGRYKTRRLRQGGLRARSGRDEKTRRSTWGGRKGVFENSY